MQQQKHDILHHGNKINTWNGIFILYIVQYYKFFLDQVFKTGFC